MSVQFDVLPVLHCYAKDEDDSENSYVQDGMDRLRAERITIRHRKSHLNTALTLFKKFKDAEITILFGNLGRHPLVLNYLLDFGFTAEESVGVLTPWNTECPYKVNLPLPSLDYLFIVEPYFGASISKLENVKHVIVLSSHLNLQYDPSSCALENFQVGYPPEPLVYSTQRVARHIFNAPAFHNGKANQIPNKSCIHIDIENAKNAHEAYLRLLTAKELFTGRPVTVTIGMSPRNEQHIKFQMRVTREKVKELGWRKKWIEEGYFQELKTSDRVILLRD